MNEKYDIAILGGGPGGYVAAIRASQLGFKTVVIDKDNLGGICLNWGCIPTKSLLKNAEIIDTIKNNSKDFGITIDGFSYDFKKIIKRSRNISERITKNAEFLIKKNKIDRIRGFGKFSSKNTLDIFDENDSPRSNRIQVTLRHATEDEAVHISTKSPYLAIEVVDNGPGVPIEERDKLFTIVKSSRPQGMGIGLARCRRFARLAGGDVCFDAAHRDGAKFVIIMPYELA